MPRAPKRTTVRANATATVGYEAQLWQMADALRGSMDAAEYKHVCLGLLFLKYISDAFEEKHAALLAEKAQGADPEDPDEYRAQGIFWVPPEARWAQLKAQARQSTIGQLVDDAMAGIERDNPALKGVLPRDYARPALDKQRLGQLIDMISNIRVGDEASRAKDVLGRVYEYFLSQFASAEGKKGGEFYTPRCVVKLLVEMLEPYRGRLYDPCCVLWRDDQGYTQSQRAADLPGVSELVAQGALLGQLWMEGQLGVGDPLVNQGAPSRPQRERRACHSPISSCWSKSPRWRRSFGRRSGRAWRSLPASLPADAKMPGGYCLLDARAPRGPAKLRIGRSMVDFQPPTG